MPFCSLEVALFVQLAAAEGKDRSAREADAAAAADKLAKAEGRLRALRAEGLPKVRQVPCSWHCVTRLSQRWPHRHLVARLRAAALARTQAAVVGTRTLPH